MRACAGLAGLLVFSAPAAAFDCAKAVSEFDKAICANDAAREANAAMEQAYFSLRGKLGSEGKALLLSGQRDWIGFRNERCGPIAGCLAERTVERTEMLEAAPDGMAPFFRWQKGVENGYEVTLSGYRFTDREGAAETAFNA